MSNNTQQGFVPTGSYQQTCRQIGVTLICKAQKVDGSYTSATLDLTDLNEPDVWNDNGTLKIASGSVTQNGYQPGGSWKLTCIDVKVELTCEAQKIDGSWIPAAYDLTNAQQVDLWNDNGVLKNAD